MTSTVKTKTEPRVATPAISAGGYIAQRLVDLRVKHYFSVPGDYNLVLFDELLKNKSIQMIACCNELNAGYAADGYARAHGIGAAFVTFGVGSNFARNSRIKFPTLTVLAARSQSVKLPMP
jgi:TPP-dependent 2-oxoacid decarboxylase